MNFQPLIIDILLAGGALLLLVMDVITPAGRKRGLGDTTVFILAACFFATFTTDAEGVALFGAYVGGAWPMFFKRIFLGAGAIAVLGCLDYVDRRFPTRQGEFYLLILCSLLGMTLLPGARNLVLLVVCFELMGMPMAILAAYAKNDDADGPDRHAPEAGMKLYLVGAASTAIALFGISIVYGMSGTTDLAGLATTPTSPMLTLGLFMTLAGMGFKLGVVPFHLWVPDTYQGAPTPFVAFLSVAPKAAGFAALALVFIIGLGGHRDTWMPVMVFLIVATLVIGNLLALPQTNVKRLLAYSGVAQIGYILMAFVAGGVQGMGVLLFYLAGYAVTNIGAFLVVHAVTADLPDAEMGAFDGLARRSPGLALALLLFLLSLAGIPFVVGFWAKLYAFLAIYQAGMGWLVLLGALLAVVSLWYYLQVARAAYMNPPADAAPVATGFAMRLAIGLCLVGVVGMGLWPRPFVESAHEASRSVLQQPLKIATPVATVKERARPPVRLKKPR